MKSKSHWIWWGGVALFTPGFITWIGALFLAQFSEALSMPAFDRRELTGVYLPMLAAAIGFALPLFCARWFRGASWRINGIGFGIYFVAMLTWGIFDVRAQNYQFGGHDYPGGRIAEGHRHYTHSYWTWYFLPYRWIERSNQRLPFSDQPEAPAMNSKIDVNQPVMNPSLVAAMNRLAADPTDAAKEALLAELNHAVYLVAVFTDEMQTTEPDKDGMTTIEKGSLIKVLNSSDDDGNAYLPLFTDWDALRKTIDQPVSSWVLPAKDAWSLTLQGENYQGAVINPAENALPLSREQCAFLHHQSETANGAAGVDPSE